MGFQKYKKFKVSKVAVKISFFVVHRRFCDWYFEKLTKYLEKGILCVKIKIENFEKCTKYWEKQI